ncbi:hypothetical protein SNEBB_004745 [Seison nebaliae]|nr:hypothetical protein SNEBB_004745 [Seison nebaliae]
MRNVDRKDVLGDVNDSELDVEMEKLRIDNNKEIKRLMKDIEALTDFNNVDHYEKIRELFTNGNYSRIQEIFGIENNEEINKNNINTDNIVEDPDTNTIIEAMDNSTISTSEMISLIEKNSRNKIVRESMSDVFANEENLSSSKTSKNVKSSISLKKGENYQKSSKRNSRKTGKNSINSPNKKTSLISKRKSEESSVIAKSEESSLISEKEDTCLISDITTNFLFSKSETNSIFSKNVQSSQEMMFKGNLTRNYPIINNGKESTNTSMISLGEVESNENFGNDELEDDDENNNNMEVINLNENNKKGRKRMNNVQYRSESMIEQSPKVKNLDFFRTQFNMNRINPATFKLFTENKSLLDVLHVLEKNALLNNQSKLDALWRKELYKRKKKSMMMNEVNAEDTCLRILSGKDRAIEILTKELEDCEEQYQFCYARHADFIDKIADRFGYKDQASSIIKHFYDTIESLRDHFETLHYQMLQRHVKSIQYIQDVTYAMEKDAEDAALASKADSHAIRDEIKTKHLEDKHQLQIKAEQKLDEIWKQFFDLMKKDRALNGDRRNLLKEYMAYDEECVEEICMNERVIEEHKKTIASYKIKIEKRKEKFDAINGLLLNNRLQVTKHYKELKNAMNRMMIVLNNRLKNLSVTSDNVIRRLETTLKEGEKTVTLCRLAGRLRRQEDMIAFEYEKQRMDNMKMVECEDLNKSLAKLDKSLDKVKNFYMDSEHFSLHWMKDNKIRLDIILLRKERDQLLEEKGKLKELMDRYITEKSRNGIPLLKSSAPLIKVGTPNRYELGDPCLKVENDKFKPKIERVLINVEQVTVGNSVQDLSFAKHLASVLSEKEVDKEEELSNEDVADGNKEEELSNEDVADQKKEEELSNEDVADQKKEKKLSNEDVADGNKEEEFSNKDVADQNKEEELSNEDVTDGNKEEELSNKDVADQNKEEELSKEDVADGNKEEELSNEDVADGNKEEELSKKDVADGNKEEELSKKDVADQDKEEELSKKDVADQNKEEELSKEDVGDGNKEEEISNEDVADENKEEELSKKNVADQNKEKELSNEDVTDGNKEEELDQQEVNADNNESLEEKGQIEEENKEVIVEQEIESATNEN